MNSIVASQCTSINFDAQALHEAEEAEYQREDQERQNELKAILSNAFDDLIDSDEDDVVDDVASEANTNDLQETLIISSEHQDSGSEWPMSTMPAWKPGNVVNQQTSTPRMEKPLPPSLKTPASLPYYGQNNDLSYSESNNDYMDDGQYGDGQFNDIVDGEGQYGAGQFNDGHQYGEEPFSNGDHYGTEQFMYWNKGNNGEDFNQYQAEDDTLGGYGNGTVQPDGRTYDSGRYVTDYGNNFNYPANGGYIQQPSTFPYDSHQNQVHSGRPIATSDMGGAGEQALMSTWPQLQQHPQTRRDSPIVMQQTVSPTRAPKQWTGADDASNNMVGYKVQYKQTDGSAGNEPTARVDNGTTYDTNETSEKIPRREEPVITAHQDEFFLADGSSTDVRHLAQLQILNRAREKRIAELTEELKQVKQDSSRDIRILKHTVTMAQDEKEGAMNSLTESQHLLLESERSKSQLEGQMTALQLQLTSLKTENEDLVKKVMTSESVIESLKSQLSEVGSTESWTRAKQQHDSIVAGLRQKHETELLKLREQLDQHATEINDKSNEIINLKKQVAEIMKASELSQMERAESINRLTRSLHESQLHCNQLLEAGTGKELSKLKIQMQDLLASKSISEDMNSALQAEISDLKEQVIMYESASQYGIFQNGSSMQSKLSSIKNVDSIMDDSYAQLGIKRTQSSAGRSETDETFVVGLKNELERCLSICSNKRQQVSTLKEELKSANMKLAEAAAQLEVSKRTADESQAKLSELTKCKPGQSINEMKLQKEVDRLTKDQEALLKELSKLQQRLVEATNSEALIKESYCELSRQMSEMIKDHDEDKRTAIEKCQNAVMEHHEMMLQSAKDQLLHEFEQKSSTHKHELSTLEEELFETKQLYIECCQAKDAIEDTLNKKWQTKLDEELAQLREKLMSDKDYELEKLKQSMMTSHADDKIKWLERQKTESEAKLSRLREEWMKKQEEEMRQMLKEVEEEKEKLRQQLEEDEEEERALKNTLSRLEEEKEKIKVQLEDKFRLQMDDQLEQAKKDWQSKAEADYNKRMELALIEAKEVWRLGDLAEEIDKARKVWNSTELVQHLEEARRDWENNVLQKAIDDVKNQCRTVELTTEVNKIKGTLERSWQGRIEMLKKQHDDAMKASSEELKSVLAKTEQEWSQRLTDIVAEKEKERADLLRLADEHIETEINKLKEHLSEQVDHSECDAKLASLEQKYRHQLKKILDERNSTKSHLGSAHQEKLNLETERAALVEKLASASAELVELKGKLSDLQKSESMRIELQTTLEELKKDYTNVEKEKSEMEEKMKATEEQCQLTILNYKRQVVELTEKLQRAEKVFKAMEAKNHKRMSILQDSLEREHAAVIAELKTNMTEKCNEQSREVERIKEKYRAEVEQMRRRLELAESVAASPRTQSASQQLEEQKQAVEEMRNFYLEAVEKVKGEVLRHAVQANQQMACVMSQKLLRERHRTAKHLRKYYLKCLDQLLHADFDRSFTDRILASMEKLLDNIPSEPDTATTNSLSSSQTSAALTSLLLSARSEPNEGSRFRPVNTSPLSLNMTTSPKTLVSRSKNPTRVPSSDQPVRDWLRSTSESSYKSEDKIPSRNDLNSGNKFVELSQRSLSSIECGRMTPSSRSSCNSPLSVSSIGDGTPATLSDRDVEVARSGSVTPTKENQFFEPCSQDSSLLYFDSSLLSHTNVSSREHEMSSETTPTAKDCKYNAQLDGNKSSNPEQTSSSFVFQSDVQSRGVNMERSRRTSDKTYKYTSMRDAMVPLPSGEYTKDSKVLPSGEYTKDSKVLPTDEHTSMREVKMPPTPSGEYTSMRELKVRSSPSGEFTSGRKVKVLPSSESMMHRSTSVHSPRMTSSMLSLPKSCTGSLHSLSDINGKQNEPEMRRAPSCTTLSRSLSNMSVVGFPGGTESSFPSKSSSTNSRQMSPRPNKPSELSLLQQKPVSSIDYNRTPNQSSGHHRERSMSKQSGTSSQSIERPPYRSAPIAASTPFIPANQANQRL